MPSDNLQHLDPNDNLQKQRDIVQRLEVNEADSDEDLIELAELVHALDEWLSGGGWPPDAWRKTGP